jgi:hypothetical protein
MLRVEEGFSHILSLSLQRCSHFVIPSEGTQELLPSEGLEKLPKKDKLKKKKNPFQ